MMMTLTFADARAIVRNAEEPFWNAEGTFHVAEIGREDATHFYVYAGPREEPRLESLTFTAFARFVSKKSGDVEVVPMISALDRLGRMTEVSSRV